MNRLTFLVLLLGIFFFQPQAENRLELFSGFFWDRNKTEAYSGGFLYQHQWNEQFETRWSHIVDGVTGATRTLTESLDGRSGATEMEFRSSDQIAARYETGASQIKMNGGGSWESDYDSYTLGASYGHNFFEDNFFVEIGGSYSHGIYKPLSPFTVEEKGEKQLVKYDLKLSQLLSKRSYVYGSLSLQNAEGYLGRPYQLVKTLSGSILSEQVPHVKTSGMAVFGLSWAPSFFEKLTLLDWRGSASTDSWGMRTLEGRFKVERRIAEWLDLRFRLRYYQQSQVTFYRESPVPLNLRYRTVDIRYADFKSVGTGIRFLGWFPESWDSDWLPDQWELKWDGTLRNTKGNFESYQLYGKDEYYLQQDVFGNLIFLF